MQISTEELQAAARDARIELTLTEEKELQTEIQHFFNQIQTLLREDLIGIAMTFYGQEKTNIWRTDLVKPSLPLEVALANAPATDESCFLVPRIIEE